jgi:hypothetical protein
MGDGNLSRPSLFLIILNHLVATVKPQPQAPAKDKSWSLKKGARQENFLTAPFSIKLHVFSYRWQNSAKFTNFFETIDKLILNS